MDKYVVRSCPNCGGVIYRYFSLYQGWRQECFGCGYQNGNQSRQQKPSQAVPADSAPKNQ